MSNVKASDLIGGTVEFPKWPQLMIVGDDVKEDTAKEIIFRTDRSLSELSNSFSGNDREFNKWYLDQCMKYNGGIERLKQLDPGQQFRLEQTVRSNINFIPFYMLTNDWSMTSFVFGPHGFCSPKGEIYFQDNIGKWPSMEEVYKDFCSLAEAFPFLNLKSTVYNAEANDDVSDHQPLVSFVVSNGEVTVTTEDFKLRENHYIAPSDSDFMSSVLQLMSNDHSHERGLPQSWYEEFSERIAQTVYESGYFE